MARMAHAVARAGAGLTPAQSQALGFEPGLIRNIDDTGLNLGWLADLVIKVLYFSGYIAGSAIADQVRLPFVGAIDQVLEFLKREQFCEVKGTGGFGEAAYQYSITAKGSAKAREVLERSQYVGPAPVRLEAYTEAMARQSLRGFTVTQRVMRQALDELVLAEQVFHQIGPAVNSGRSLFLYGPPGNGKTSVAEVIGKLVLGGDMWIPYALEVGGQVVKIYDNVNHQIVEEPAPTPGQVAGPLKGKVSASRDPRWIRVRRPVIITGGELTLESLDLVWDDVRKYYEAPFQMKANGGMLLIDDFGRQQVRPRDLLNRWIVPLEKRIDYLTLHTGRKIEIPFDVLIVFSTNLAPRDLVDEAFLRRIRHKIEITDPTFDEFKKIFQRVCTAKKVPFNEQGLTYLLQEYYIKPRRKLRAVHPRDLVDQIVDISRYLNVEPQLTKDLLDRACESYFVEL
jgi:predicted ATPase with chaperone activity